MRFTALSVLVALAVLVGFSSENAPASSKPSGSSSSKPKSSSSYNPGIFFPPSGSRPWSGSGSTYVRGNARLNNGARVVPVHVDFTVTFNTDVGKVRTIDPPQEYDEKGYLKKPTADELKKLKGDEPAEKKMIGYKSDYSELQVGDIVQVAVSVHKNAESKKDSEKVAAEDGKETKPPKWVVAGHLLGKITKIENSNSESAPKVTVQVTGSQVIQPRPARPRQSAAHDQAGGGAGDADRGRAQAGRAAEAVRVVFQGLSSRGCLPGVVTPGY